MSSLVSPGIETLRPYAAGKPIEEVTRELGIADVIKLASNENPLGPSPKALEAAAAALSGAHRYPDASAHALRTELARQHGVSMDELIQGNGSNEILELLVRTFTTPEQHIVFAEPSFVVYRMAALAHGVPFTAVPLRNQVHDLDAMLAAITDKTRLVFIANPNNPTGTHVGQGALGRFLTAVPDHVIVALDEAYFEYATAADYPDGLKNRGLHKKLVVLRTFSKIHGLAAFRVGYAIGDAELVGYMHRVRAPFNVGIVGQVAALAALADTDHVSRSRELNESERSRLAAGLQNLGIEPVPSQGNFLFFEAPISAASLYDALLQKGVIVRAFAGAQIRVTVGLPAENQRFLTALGEVLA
ncbi:MAG: histidinol-phosphate transaminase [Polyangiaceae bacterium]|nr:histidinol-phosphate transaminase [Polyangiaceae bacterium]